MTPLPGEQSGGELWHGGRLVAKAPHRPPTPGAEPLLQLVPEGSLVGVELDGYVIERVLSEGRQSVVYLARHRVLGRRVAIKVLRTDRPRPPGAATRFLDEAALLQRLVSHPALAGVLDVGTLSSGQQYLTMELAQGEPLAELLTREGPLPMVRALTMCEQMLSGLAATYEAGIVHRDLKPSNVMVSLGLDGASAVKLVDFGLARGPRERGDVYSVGMVLFEMLTNRLPLCTAEHGHQRQLRELLPSASPAVDDLLANLLDQDPAARPASATAALKTVRALLRHESKRALPAQAGSRQGRDSHRWLGTALLVSGLVIGATTAVRSWANDQWRPHPRQMRPDDDSALVQRAARTPPKPELSPAPEPRQAVDSQPTAATAVLAPQPLPRPAAPRGQRGACEPTEAWRASMAAQVEELEQRSLARLADDADPSAVAAVGRRARERGAEIRSAQGQACQRAESHLLAWRATLGP